MNAIESAIRSILVEEHNIKEHRIRPTSRLREDLGLRPFNIVSLCMALEDRFKITIDEQGPNGSDAAQTVADLTSIVSRIKIRPYFCRGCGRVVKLWDHDCAPSVLRRKHAHTSGKDGAKGGDGV